MDGETAGRRKVRDRGQLTLPHAVRAVLGVDTGDEVEFVVLTSGQVAIHGLKMIPADQAWFWNESWQRGEREASEDIENRRVETYKDSESFLDVIKVPDSE